LSLMTIVTAPARRRRRQPDELRHEAIIAARELLVTDGPSSITLQAVAAALGMTHGSITHHFGAAANLQAAVADGLIEQLLTEVRTGTSALKAGVIAEADLVDLVFDTFEQTGIGKLIGWLSATHSPLLQPLFERFSRLSGEIAGDREEGSAFTQTELPMIIESVVIPALGSALIGSGLLQALNISPNCTRHRVARDLAVARELRIAVSRANLPD
jgi:TetR/AcrR family transcriptional regulator, repressor for neighboring sulfatase